MDATYDIESRVEGEEQPQLEVSPITMYVTEYAENQYCQIAVNSKFICYGKGTSWLSNNRGTMQSLHT